MAREYRFDFEVEYDDDVEELIEILEQYGPYVTHDGYEYIAFSDPALVTEGFRDPSKCLTIPHWHLYEVYRKDLEAERATAETVSTLSNLLHLEDDEIREYMADKPDYFDVSLPLMNDQLKKVQGRNCWFDLPDFD